MKVYEAVARTLVDEGVDTVFGLMGDGNLKLIPHLTSDLGVRFLGARHEAAAVAMADGWARVTGRVAVCTVTQGPGLTNALTPLISARKARTPLVLLAGDTPLGVRGLPQDTDQDALFAAAGVPVQAFTAEGAAQAVAAALALAADRPGPVGVSMPTDLQDQDLPPSTGTAPAAATGPAGVARSTLGGRPPGGATPSLGGELDGVRAGLDERRLREAAALLGAAQRPVVLAGRGAIRSGARDALVALSDRSGALLTTSLPAKAWFAGHPWDLGVCGGFASPVTAELVRDADVVAVFGASVNSFTSKAGTLFRGTTRLVHVDADPAALGAYTPAAVGVVGDARAAAEQLLALLDDAVRGGYRTAEVRARIDAYDRATAHADASGPEGLDPRTVCAALDRLLPRERTVVTDGGHFCGFPAAYLSVPEPSALVFTLDFGSVGLGLGAAIGAAIGRPDRLTVAAIGDGGLMMSLGDLDTAVRYRVPLLILALDDGAYGAEMHFLRMLGLPDAESLFATPDLAAVARALGAQGLRIHALEELADLAERAVALDGPLLVHIPVTRDVRAGWLEEAFARSVH